MQEQKLKDCTNYLVGQVRRVTHNLFAPSSFPFWCDTNNFPFLIELYLQYAISNQRPDLTDQWFNTLSGITTSAAI